jgi:hypothetical protein
MNYSEIHTKDQGTIKISLTEVKIENALPVGLISVKLNIVVEPGKYTNSNNESINVYYLIKPKSLTMIFNQKELLFSDNGYFTFVNTNRKFIYGLPINFTNLVFNFNVDTAILNYIESLRKDDITLNFIFYSEYLPVSLFSDSRIKPIDAPFELYEREFIVSLSYDFSEKKWIKFLDDLGYGGKWIIEIDRPPLEGFDKMSTFLERAKDELYSKSNPAGVIDELRRARDSFKVYFDEYKEEIYNFIDHGCVSEQGQLTKSQRIENMYETISKWLNIGPHGDKYNVTYQDALLAYRQFITMLSYLSLILTEIQRQEKAD